MKLRLLGLVLMVAMLLTPALASAAWSPIDGLYVSTMGYSSVPGIDLVGYEVGIGGDETGFDPLAGVYLPSATLLAPGKPVLDKMTGLYFTQITKDFVSFMGTLGEYSLSGNLLFSGFNSEYGFMHMQLSAVAVSADSIIQAGGLFEKQTHTPIPGAFLLLGTGLVGLVGLRKKFQA